MIIQGELSDEQRAQSQKNYIKFTWINGASYMCLGETMIILLAIRMHVPDFIIAAIGAMLYFGYLLLPLGKMTTARVGAASSQSLFWIWRNCAALLVGLSVPVTLYWSDKVGMAMLLVGAFFFYGFRSAGVVMSQPLFGEMTAEEDRAHFLGKSNSIFYFSCFSALLIISQILHFYDNLLALTLIVVIGAALGFTSSRFLHRIYETDKIQHSARNPFLGELKVAFANSTLRRQIMAGFAINLSVIMMVPISMAALKRGYGVSDADALYYSMVQFASAAVMSVLAGKLAVKIGPRRTMMVAYCLILCVGLIWFFSPDQFHWYVQLLPFILAGGGTVGMANSMMHYFLQTVPVRNRVGASMFIATVNGAGAGLIGMVVAGSLLQYFVGSDSTNVSLDGYRRYFLCATIVLAVGIWIIGRLKPLPTEKRRIRRSWWWWLLLPW